MILTMKSHSEKRSVFISGSRALRMRDLDGAVLDKLRSIIDKQLTVLIGDANGADEEVQMFLRGEGYRNVVVYCMGDKCRNNEGKWKERAIPSKGTRKNFSYFAQKDKVMSQDADYGLMLWDGKSKGTLNNVLNMLKEGKPSLVCFSIFDKDVDTVNDGMKEIKSADDVEELVAKCGDEARAYFDRIIRFSARVKSLQQVQSQQGKPQQSKARQDDWVDKIAAGN